MSDIIKKIITAAAGAAMMLSVTGCGADGVYGTSISKEEQETDYSSVYAEIIEFHGFPDREYQSLLNEQIEEDVKGAIDDFDSEAAETELPAGVKAALSIKQNVKRNSGGIISFITENYTYLGGAHGITRWLPYTVNAASDAPRILELRELFEDEEGYVNTINRMIDELIAQKPEEYTELWAEPHITLEQQRQFYMTDEELVIFFPPYVLSYYAKGFIEFPLRLTELNGYLKEEFRTEAPLLNVDNVQALCYYISIKIISGI